MPLGVVRLCRGNTHLVVRLCGRAPARWHSMPWACTVRPCLLKRANMIHVKTCIRSPLSLNTTAWLHVAHQCVHTLVVALDETRNSANKRDENRERKGIGRRNAARTCRRLAWSSRKAFSFRIRASSCSYNRLSANASTIRACASQRRAPEKEQRQTACESQRWQTAV